MFIYRFGFQTRPSAAHRMEDSHQEERESHKDLLALHLCDVVARCCFCALFSIIQVVSPLILF